jgi:hypothetical protein
MFASVAGAEQKCSDTYVVGRATDGDHEEAFKNADVAWEKESSSKLGAKVVYHENPRTTCASTNGTGTKEFTCTVSAKACTSAPARVAARRAICHVSGGGCEICCFDVNTSETTCHPQCK